MNLHIANKENIGETYVLSSDPEIYIETSLSAVIKDEHFNLMSCFVDKSKYHFLIMDQILCMKMKKN